MSTIPSLPFNPELEKIFCSFCGTQCIKSGHMFSKFYLCPNHGEFTIAPTVIETKQGWEIQFESHTMKNMWQTCKSLPNGENK